jgi:hypothetical protein
MVWERERTMNGDSAWTSRTTDNLRAHPQLLRLNQLSTRPCSNRTWIAPVKPKRQSFVPHSFCWDLCTVPHTIKPSSTPGGEDDKYGIILSMLYGAHYQCCYVHLGLVPRSQNLCFSTPLLLRPRKMPSITGSSSSLLASPLEASHVSVSHPLMIIPSNEKDKDGRSLCRFYDYLNNEV